MRWNFVLSFELSRYKYIFIKKFNVFINKFEKHVCKEKISWFHLFRGKMIKSKNDSKR
jgi:hypothetical protein